MLKLRGFSLESSDKKIVVFELFYFLIFFIFFLKSVTGKEYFSFSIAFFANLNLSFILFIPFFKKAIKSKGDYYHHLIILFWISVIFLLPTLIGESLYNFLNRSVTLSTAFLVSLLIPGLIARIILILKVNNS